MDIFSDDVLFEILTRLPAKSLHRFKSVSKRWYSIIHNSSFVASYISRHSLSSSSSISSLYIVHRNILLSPPHSAAVRLDFTPSPNVSHFHINQSLLLSRNEIISYDDESQFPDAVLQYDHGLMLISAESYRDPNREKITRTQTRFSHFFGDNYDRVHSLFVCSVVTREWFRIPQPPHPLDQCLCIGFIARVEDDRPWVVSKFLVMEYQHLVSTNGALMMCFSSDTGKWVVKEADYVLGLHAWRPDWVFAYKGRLYWAVLSIGITVWDEDPFCALENERKAICRFIPLPPGCDQPICTPEMAERRRVGVSCGFIQFVEMIMSGETALKLWRLSDTESGNWVLLHKVSQDYLISYMHHHLGLHLPTICFIHPTEFDTVFFQTGLYILSYNLRTGKVVSVAKFRGHGEFLQTILPTWPTSIPPRLYAAYAKEEGNELFKGGKFDEAISCYSRSITLSASAPVYANRALAYLKLNRFQEAEDDCTKVLSLDRDYLKAYGRRAVARKELGNLQGSMEDVEYALKLEPNNQGLKKQYTDIQSLLDKERA